MPLNNIIIIIIISYSKTLKFLQGSFSFTIRNPTITITIIIKK